MSSLPSATSLRVVIVAQNASTRFGGEAILPWHYFRLLRKRGVDVRLVVHERTREELMALLPHEAERMYFVPDRPIQRVLYQLGRRLPQRVFENTLGLGVHAATSLMQRELVRQLVSRHAIDVIHEPIPVSPKHPSFMFDLGAPVVIGPMNGGMDFPPGFASQAGLLERVVLGIGRELSHGINRLIPGKLHAAALLTANERSLEALPRSIRRGVMQLSENGVDLTLFNRREHARHDDAKVRFVFVGRLVEFKRVDLLLRALAQSPARYELHVLGDGPLRPALEAKTDALRLRNRVMFHGLVSQQTCSQQLARSDVLVLPSVRECGGAVVLEAMAMGLPVIAADWGGPADYLDGESGILVPPQSPAELVRGLSAAMLTLGEDPALRARMGAAGRARVEREYDWERKIDRIVEVYAQVAWRGARREKPRDAGISLDVV
jgi:glycosyltransferase involved in cell wall biosynthesis